MTRTGGRVNGYLRKHVAAGAGVSLVFEIGDATRYTPVSVAFGTVVGAGELTANTTPGEHPDVVNSGVDPAQDVNRYWTISRRRRAVRHVRRHLHVRGRGRRCRSQPEHVHRRQARRNDVDAAGGRDPDGAEHPGARDDLVQRLRPRRADHRSRRGRDRRSGERRGRRRVEPCLHDHGHQRRAVGRDDRRAQPRSGRPASARVRSARRQGSCAPVGAGPDFSCALGTIPAGGSATVGRPTPCQPRRRREPRR